MTGNIWSVLGLEPTNDRTEIKRAYARRLKLTNPEDDPEGFQALREAYEAAAAEANAATTGAAPREWSPAPDAARAVDWDQPVAPRTRTYAPFVDTLTIDEMLEEMALDEQREPLHDLLRHRLVGRLTDILCSDEERLAALHELLTAPAMKSSRLYQITEDWLATLISRNRRVTELLVEPCIAFFEWDKPRHGKENPYGRQAIMRRRALQAIDQLRDGQHPLHRAYAALSGSAWGPDRLRFRFALGLRAQVVRLMADVDRNRELELALNEDSVSWWRFQVRTPGLPPTALWLLVVTPPLVAALPALARPDEFTFGGFFTAWFIALAAMWLAALGVHAVVAFRRLA